MSECTYCHERLDTEEEESPKTDQGGDVMCDDCYKTEYMQTCPICEDWFDSPRKPEDTFLIISKELSREISITPGIYRVKSYPYFFGDIVCGFHGLFDASIELVREIDINSMLRGLYGKHTEKIEGGEICEECYKKFSSSKHKYVNYVDPHVRLHMNITARGIMKQGF